MYVCIHFISLDYLPLCCSHVLPIKLNEYAATIPMEAQRIAAGSNADFSSAKNAIPDGKDKTPAPTILLAKLNVDVAMVACPPFFTVVGVVAAAVMYNGDVLNVLPVVVVCTTFLPFVVDETDANAVTVTMLTTINKKILKFISFFLLAYAFLCFCVYGKIEILSILL